MPLYLTAPPVYPPVYTLTLTSATLIFQRSFNLQAESPFERAHQ